MSSLRITFVYNDFEHLGTAYLIASAKRAGHAAAYVHYQQMDQFQFSNHAENVDAIVERIARTRPQVVGFSCITANYQSQLAIARAIKARLPGVKTLFGGIHVTLTAERVLRKPEVDCVVRGEGEEVLALLLDGCGDTADFWPAAAPAGATFKRADGGVVGAFDMAPKIRDLNALPDPDKEEIYAAAPLFAQEYQIMASRGCAYTCTYCYAGSIPITPGEPRILRREPEDVIAELERAVRRYGAEAVTFHDDIFTASRPWLERFLPLYKARVGLPFCCSTYPASMDPPKARALKDAGCIYIAIGVQSLSEEICRNVLNRPIDPDRVRDCINALNEVGLMNQVDHILDIPGDTQANSEKALLFYNETRPSRIQVFQLNYLPKAPIIQHALAHDAIDPDEIEAVEEGTSRANFYALYQTASRDTRATAFLLNWMMLLPKPLVRYLVRSGLYKRIYLPGPYVNLIIPRVILALISANDLRGRHHLRRFAARKLGGLFKWAQPLFALAARRNQKAT
ncbi:B12-binding domain-containing radical SAM protein [Magnetofaba australis]|uniref:Putative radical SAM protein n=1 Tax=Magnetofaba australis IT-1 TaxID=1434232 RepID=A0A1Y2K1N8_9PROT|nr:radical SAM protein [Magnetofaba australis]OSM01923.1 putative radical SAM protein [Magnetofaba australis IT-1]